MKRRIALRKTIYEVNAPVRLRIAVLADFHGSDPEPALEMLTEDPPDLILLPVLFILGGMSFHLFWEADGRYVVRYYNFLFLLSAAGLEQVSAAVQTLLRRFRTPTPRT